ncbi:glycosyltransferase family 2 protein [Salinimicrobium sediminis]|uniref:glycosyltransferase family 2 protein n=1 Tax=Salinimicrobium sediminis TaxID=1343891 RepID=UPI0015C792AE|nr:glycosyltransferase family A protein [Salinimicrobium sediminis]
MISIIIPTFNSAHSLPVTIKSVLDQTDNNWELIIIDDGSTDETKEVIKHFLDDERIIYHFQKNLGVTTARNMGVELSRGEYIIFLDSDDRFLPGLLNRLKEENYTQNDLICWQVSKLIDGKSSIWKPEKLEMIYNSITATFLAGSICYRKDVFLKAGGFDPEMTFGENYELGIRIGQIPSLKIKIVDEPFLIYNIDSSNRPSSSVSKKISSHERLLSKHIDLYKTDPISHSRLQYQLGYLYERKGEDRHALGYYQMAWKRRRLYLKPFLKIPFLRCKILLKKRSH